jgi:hypothetical protein
MPAIIRDLSMLCGAAIGLALLAGCDRPETVVIDEELPTETRVPGLSVPATDDINEVEFDATITVDGVRVQIPARWRPATPSSQFTAAQYTIPGSDASQNASITISNPIGGGLMYNILRWDRQFRGDHSQTEAWVTMVDGSQVLVFSGRGPFDTGLPDSQGVQDDMAVLGAVPIVNGSERIDSEGLAESQRVSIEIDQSVSPTMPRNIFIKLTGPVETVHAARAEWDAMLGTIRVRDVSEWATP